MDTQETSLEDIADNHLRKEDGGNLGLAIIRTTGEIAMPIMSAAGGYMIYIAGILFKLSVSDDPALALPYAASNFIYENITLAQQNPDAVLAFLFASAGLYALLKCQYDNIVQHPPKQATLNQAALLNIAKGTNN